MKPQFVTVGFLIALACPFAGYAQYDLVPSSIREEQIVLSNGEPAHRQTFQILPRKVVRGNYKNYVATLIRDDQTGLVWFTFEGAPDIQTTRPTRNWGSPEFIVAKSKNGRSLVGFEAYSSILTFIVSDRTAGSMDSARALAMTELSAKIAAFEADPMIPPPRSVDLNPHLDLSTFSGAAGLSRRDIKRVTATDDGWLVELSSHPTVHKTAVISLSQDFKFLKVDVRRD
jgi:hypothetical protein